MCAVNMQAVIATRIGDRKGLAILPLTIHVGVIKDPSPLDIAVNNLSTEIGSFVFT